MPATPRPQRQPTDDWQQLRLLVTTPAQETYELLRPIVLFGQSARSRARETEVPERSLRRKVTRFAAHGMRSLFDPEPAAAPEAADRRALPLGIRRAIVELKAEYPPFGLREIARICRERFGRPVGHHTVERVLLSEPLPLRLPRRFPRYHDTPDPVARRKAIVDLYTEGWSARSIAGYLETSRARVYDTLRRWVAEDLAGLADRSRAPHHHARKVDLKAMVAIRRLQANPELGEFRIHAALEQLGIDLSPRTCGRILALHRDLGAPRPAAAAPREPQPMPFAAQRRHQYWTVDVRYVEDHRLGTGKPVYVISILENLSRALLASAISPRQDLTAYLIVLRAAVETHGAPEALVSDGGGVFRANQARAIYAALGIEKRQIDAGQAWQSSIETHFDVMRRMTDVHLARARTWDELRAAHERFVHDYNRQPHAAHGDRPKGKRSPAAVLGWVHGAWCAPADLDRLFRLRATRVFNAGGCVRFRHWRLYGERGLAGARAAVWVEEETLTIEYATEALAQYRVAYEPDGRRFRAVDEPRLFPTRYPSPQPFLPPLDAVEWHPAQRLAPYRSRRKNAGEGRQERLFAPELAAASG
jgi:transposase